MTDMIREYDKLYNGFLDSMVEMEKMKNLNKSHENEIELLDRISKLETKNNEAQMKLEKYSTRNVQLESRIQVMDKFQKEFETVNERIQEEENFNQEKLKFDLEQVTNNLNELKLENLELKGQNKKMMENYQNLEIQKNQEVDGLVQKNKELSAKLIEIEDTSNDLQIKIKQLMNELKEKSKKIDSLNSKRNEYHKKYNVINQLNKTQEVTISSLTKELGKVSKELENSKDEINRTKSLIEDLIKSWKMNNANKEPLEELIQHFGDVVSLHENFEDNLILGSICESGYELNQNLKQLDDEYNGFELNMSQMSGINLAKNPSPYNVLFMANTVGNLSLGSTPRQIKKQNISFLKQDKKEKKIIERRDDDMISIQSKFELENIENKIKRKSKNNSQIDNFQDQLQIEIENKINSRYKSNVSNIDQDILESLKKDNERVNSRIESKLNKNKFDFGHLKKILLDMIFDEIDLFSKSIIKENEVNYLKNQLSKMSEPKEYVVWIVTYLREKINEINGRNKALESEKSREKKFH